MNVRGLAIACGLVCSLGLSGPLAAAALALPGTRSEAPERNATWAVRGGEATFLLHGGLAGELGLSMVGSRRPDVDFHQVVALDIDDSSALEYTAISGMLQELVGGSLQFRGDLKLKVGDRELDLTGFTLRPKAGQPRELELVDSGGQAWLLVDHVHYEAVNNDRQLSMRNLDLRVTPKFATWLGDPALNGLAIGSMEILAEVVRSAEPSVRPETCSNLDWPGEPNSNGSGQPSVADVLLEAMSSLDYKGCQGSCDGPGGSANGAMKFAPNATLRNTNNPLTADIPWYQKFSGNFPPYNNDQHPYFVWNVYRINADGQIDQIGRSGTKHAFLTVNVGCAENCGSHILGPNCGDTYSSGNNESTSSLGPRSEIIPYSGQWGRCGSGYDANCDGAIDPTPYGAFDNRMLVRESDLEAVSNPGAQYFFEGWYLVREDINIYNTMGYRSFTPSYSSTWSAASPGAFKLGPALNQWLSHTNPSGIAASKEFNPPGNGHLRVAMKARPRPTGGWRYDYVVMNFDFANVTTTGTEPNLRLTSSRGLTAFEVTLPAGSVTEQESFKDVDIDTANNWAMTKAGNSVRWEAPASGNDLSWGSLFRFTVYGGAPVEGTARVSDHLGNSWEIQGYVPVGALPPESLFTDGAE